MPSGGASQTIVERINNINFAVFYQDEADSNHGTIRIGTIEDTDITFGDETEFLSTNGVNYISFGTLSVDKLVVAYTDVADSNHGTAKIGLATVGVIIGNAVTGEALRIIHRLHKTQDHDPQLFNTFDVSPSGVNIQVWDIIDGANNLVSTPISGCYQIGSTNTWGWSTANLPFTQSLQKYHYYFRMISNENESQYGEFFITVPEQGHRSYTDWEG